MGKKIIQVEVRERNPWGESVDESVINDAGKTNTFIEGYSDRKSRIEAGKDERPLAHRLQYVRAENPNGTADGRRVAHWKRKGYTVPKWDEVVKAGYNVDLSAAQKGPDGSVRLGDTVLMWTTADKAAAHYKKQREDTKELSRMFENKVQTAVEEANKQMGYKAGAKGATGALFEVEGGKK